ncbi:hypothetical protein K8I31_20565, partial [bacterium]|nr:hypothetical protein [bacterium]
MKRFIFFAVAIAMAISSLCAHAQSRRAIWVTRWDFKTAEDIAVIINNAKSLSATDVLFQVRGNATTFYPSKLEPWAWELTGED